MRFFWFVPKTFARQLPKCFRTVVHGTIARCCHTAFSRLAKSRALVSTLQIGAFYAARISSVPSTSVGTNGGGELLKPTKVKWAEGMCGMRLPTRSNRWTECGSASLRRIDQLCVRQQIEWLFAILAFFVVLRFCFDRRERKERSAAQPQPNCVAP